MPTESQRNAGEEIVVLMCLKMANTLFFYLSCHWPIEMQFNKCSVCVSLSPVSTGCDDKKLSSRQEALSDE